MSQTVYTNYWLNRRNDTRKEHGSYLTEEDALEAVKTWWEIQKDNYENVETYRTNTGALEINYGDDIYLYRIEKRQTDEPLPSPSYRLKTQSEIDAERKKYMLDDETLLFDELAEPYRDRLIIAMADSQKVREWLYEESGKPTVKIKDYKGIQ